ncbi:hypothetical protein BH09ACT1_BH09ACT1_16350 [soil metagenome]
MSSTQNSTEQASTEQVSTEHNSTEQASYQVRFDWSTGGIVAIGADADVVVLVDAIDSGDPAPDLAGVPAGAVVITASMPDAAAVAHWLLAHQQTTGTRIIIAIIGVGARRPGGDIRFAVEDQLAAGAIISHLTALGLDGTSPEAAAAEAAYTGLARAVAHLMTASVSALTSPVSPAGLRLDAARGAEDVKVIRR